jgi:hypothetical protein
VAFTSTKVAVRDPAPFGGNDIVIRYVGCNGGVQADPSGLIAPSKVLEHCPLASKNSVLVVAVATGFVGMFIRNCGDEAAPPRGVVTGVERKSDTIADNTCVEAVCSVAI